METTSFFHTFFGLGFLLRINNNILYIFNRVLPWNSRNWRILFVVRFLNEFVVVMTSHVASPLRLSAMTRSCSDHSALPGGGIFLAPADSSRSASIPTTSQTPMPSLQPHITSYGRAITCDGGFQTARSSVATNATQNNSSSSRGSGSSLYRDVQLIGQCRHCEKEYKCACCLKCNHFMVFYSPVRRPKVSKQMTTFACSNFSPSLLFPVAIDHFDHFKVFGNALLTLAWKMSDFTFIIQS